MMVVFEMTDLGLMTFFLGMEIKQGEHEVFVCQKKYAKEILKKFKLEECKEMNTPMNQKERLCKEDGTDKPMHLLHCQVSVSYSFPHQYHIIFSPLSLFYKFSLLQLVFVCVRMWITRYYCFPNSNILN